MNLRQHIHRPGTTTAVQEKTQVNHADIKTAEQTRRRRLGGRVAILSTLAVLTCLLGATSASAATPPEWKLTVTPNADYFLPGSAGLHDLYTLEAENVGATAAESPVFLEDTLPPGLVAGAVQFYASEAETTNNNAIGLGASDCPSFTECRFPAESQPVLPGEKLIMVIHVAIEENALTGSITDHAKVHGGGATSATKATATSRIDPEPPFGFRSFAAPLTDSSGQPYFQAGGHPDRLVTEFNFLTESVEAKCTSGGVHCTSSAPVRDAKEIHAELPPGLIGNPGAIPRCSLADFYAVDCPLKTVIGSVGVRYEQSYGGLRELGPLYNLVPFGEFPGALGFQSAFPLLFTASVRSGSDYGLTIAAAGTPMASINRIRVTTWGVPAEASHDPLRGKTCLDFAGSHAEMEPFANTQTAEEAEQECEGIIGEGGTTGGPAGVEHPHPYLTMPTECSGAEASFNARFDTWQLPPSEEASASYPEPAVEGCNALSFEPEIEAHPTTNLADSPSGLEFKLTVPQRENCTEPPSVSCEPATPELKEASVILPRGLSVNPSSANGLAACSPQQIGLNTAVGVTPAHFSEEPNQCPTGAKIGTAEVHTSLLNEPLDGSVYLATPKQNPFVSFLAAYIVLEGQGLVFKLPGRIETDPQTGQITGRFLENPELPFESFELRFFGGAKGDLRTPAVCGSYKTSSVLTPYSAPESGPSAEPGASFETTNGGAACPSSASGESNSPAFRAGTESPEAGKFSPFSFRLARADGSQELAKIETTLPPGLTGKLAGVAECSDAQIAAAQGREHEGGGAEEQASPSCPSSSEVGTVEVGAGAGPTPLNVQGRAYLSGPYKGAPLSLAIITPAVAGPFDLGTVVVKTALYVDPFSAQIHAVSDEIPHILQGIPLDVRSIVLKMNRPNFTLNPTNCEELGFTGAATSLLGLGAPLAQRFQVGGCNTLPFKPKLALSLKGGTRRHTFPALTATLTMPPGSANIASAQVTLPHSEQLEQAHINTVCTRPQLASHTCPTGSIYGYAKAVTPLLDQPLEGPVYLGVGFGHELPDLVADLNGQIEVLLHGKVDTGREDGIRNTFEVVPDAPVSKFTLSLFGGKKSLIVNSENICGPRAKTKSLAKFSAQNGKTVELEPTVQNSCKKGGKGKKKGGGQKHRVSRLVGTSHR